MQNSEIKQLIVSLTRLATTTTPLVRRLVWRGAKSPQFTMTCFISSRASSTNHKRLLTAMPPLNITVHNSFLHSLLTSISFRIQQMAFSFRPCHTRSLLSHWTPVSSSTWSRTPAQRPCRPRPPSTRGPLPSRAVPPPRTGPAGSSCSPPSIRLDGKGSERGQ